MVKRGKGKWIILIWALLQILIGSGRLYEVTGGRQSQVAGFDPYDDGLGSPACHRHIKINFIYILFYLFLILLFLYTFYLKLHLYTHYK